MVFVFIILLVPPYSAVTLYLEKVENGPDLSYSLNLGFAFYVRLFASLWNNLLAVTNVSLQRTKKISIVRVMPFYWELDFLFTMDSLY